MQFDGIAPECLVTEGVGAERVAAFFDHPLGVIQRAVRRPGIGDQDFVGQPAHRLGEAADEHLVGLALDLHAFLGLRVARQNKLVGAADPDEARQARRGGLVSLETAERGDIDSHRPGGFQQRCRTGCVILSAWRGFGRCCLRYAVEVS